MLEQLAFKLSQGSQGALIPVLAILGCTALLFGLI